MRFIGYAACLSIFVARFSVGTNCFAEERWGSLSGRFVFAVDTPLKPTVVKEKYLARGPEVEVVPETLQVSADGGLRNAVIYLTRNDVLIHPDDKNDERADVVLEIQLTRIEPHVLTVQQSQKLVIRNSTSLPQNANSSLEGETLFNPLIPSKGTGEYEIDRISPAPLRVHNCLAPWMSAYIVCLPHRYLAISGVDGRFSIKHLPVGDYEFRIWHEQENEIEIYDLPTRRIKIKIAPGENDIGKITFKRKAA